MSISGINSPIEQESVNNESEFAELNLFSNDDESVEAKAESGMEGEEISAEEVKVESVEKKDDPFSSKFAALSRKEKELRLKEREIEKRVLELEDQLRIQGESKIEKKEDKFEGDLEYRLKSNPLKTLEELGLPFNILSKMVLEEGGVPAELKMDLMKSDLERKYEEKMKAIESKLNEFETKSQQDKVQAEIKNFEKEIYNFIDKNAEKYELIKANNAQDWVKDTIAKHYQETSIYSKDGRLLKGGEILSTDEAASLVEDYLEGELDKHLSLNKVKSKLQPATQPIKEASSKPTLTNSHSTSVPNRHEKLLPREESLKLAASLIKWQS